MKRNKKGDLNQKNRTFHQYLAKNRLNINLKETIY